MCCDFQRVGNLPCKRKRAINTCCSYGTEKMEHAVENFMKFLFVWMRG